MKASMLGLVIATAACAASSLYLWYELDAQREQAARVDEANRGLQARIAELEEARARFAQQRAESPPLLAGGRTVPASAPPVPAEGATTAESKVGAPAQVWQAPSAERSPAFKKVMRAQIRAANQRLYADLGTELGLDKETANKLIDLLTTQQVQGFDPTHAEQQVAEIQRQNQAAIEALIGPDKAQSLEEYQRSMPARAEFEMLARQLEANDSPLSAEQARRLRAAYIEERARVPYPAFEATDGTSDKYFKAMTDWEEDYNQRVSDAAAGILTSQQQNTFNDIQQWQKEMRAGVQIPLGSGGPRGFFVRGGAVPMGAVAGSVTFATPVPPPPPAETRKP